jgi:hypothetical protein
LFEPIGNQRPCCYRENCEGRFIPGAPPVVLREFVPLETMRANVASRASSAALTLTPDDTFPCLMCHRLAAQNCYNTNRAKKRPMQTRMAISRYYSLVGVVGEYSRFQTLIGPAEGLAKNIVAHSRLMYAPTRHPVTGALGFKQLYATPTNSSFF